MIKHHPLDSSLVKFSEGTLGPSDSLVLSAHCDLCPICAEKVDTFTESLALKAFDDIIPQQSVQSALVDMFCNITSSHQDTGQSHEHNPQNLGRTPLNNGRQIEFSAQHEVSAQHNNANVQYNDDRFLYLDGRKFELPETLRRYNARISEWTKLVGKLWQCQVELGGGYLAQFVYMEKGGSIPEHTHKGNELTIVIDGEFSDGLNDYETGDFISLDTNHKHIPSTQSDEGCLVFSIIDQPLHFTSGWAKLVNPLSHLYFRVNAR